MQSFVAIFLRKSEGIIGWYVQNNNIFKFLVSTLGRYMPFLDQFDSSMVLNCCMFVGIRRLATWILL